MRSLRCQARHEGFDFEWKVMPPRSTAMTLVPWPWKAKGLGARTPESPRSFEQVSSGLMRIDMNRRKAAFPVDKRLVEFD